MATLHFGLFAASSSPTLFSRFATIAYILTLTGLPPGLQLPIIASMFLLPSRRRPGQRFSSTRLAIQNSIRAQMFGAVLEVMLTQGGVLTLLVLALGGNKQDVGNLWAINFLVQGIRIFAARYVEVSSRRKMLLWSMGASSVLSLGYLLAPTVGHLTSPAVAVAFVLGAFVLQRSAANWAAAAWLPLLGEVVPDRFRGQYFGVMRATWRFTSLLAVIGAGFWLGSDPTTSRFVPVLAFGTACSVTRLWFIRRLPDPPAVREGRPEPMGPNLLRPLRDHRFRRSLFYAAAMTAASGAAMPFTVPFLRENLAFPVSMTIFAVSAVAVGAVVSLVAWGRMADRFGNRLTYMLSAQVAAGSMLVFAATPMYQSLDSMWPMASAMLAFVLLGVGTSGMGIAHTVRMFHQTPDEHRGAYMAVFATLSGVAAAVAAASAGAVLEYLPDFTSIAGTPVDTMRIYFCVVMGLMLAMGPLLRWIEPIREPEMRRAVASLAGAMPGPLGLPLAPLSLYLNRVQFGDRIRLRRARREAEERKAAGEEVDRDA